MAENETDSLEKREFSPVNGRNADGTFASGNSLGMNGRNKNMVAYIKSKVGDNGEKLVDFFMQVLEGFTVNGQIPKLNDRITAAMYLSDRAFGKPTQLIAGDGDKEPIQISFSSQIPRPDKNELCNKAQSPVSTE